MDPNNLYFKANVIRLELEKLIANLKVGSKLKSERDLATKYKVSRITIRNAVNDMVERGILKRVHGSGVYVVSPFAYKAKFIVVYKNEKVDLFETQLMNSIDKIANLKSVKIDRIEIEDLYSNTDILNDYDGLISIADVEKEIVLEKNIPEVVFFNKDIFLKRGLSVLIDDFVTFSSGINYLKKLGHKKFVYIGDFDLPNVYVDCRYKALLECAGVSNSIVLNTSVNPVSYSQVISAINVINATAVACSNDELALKVMRVLLDNGIKVPEDISIIGHDGIDVADNDMPSLTTMKIPVEDIVTTSINELLLWQHENFSVRKKIIYNPELVIGGSTTFAKN